MQDKAAKWQDSIQANQSGEETTRPSKAREEAQIVDHGNIKEKLLTFKTKNMLNNE